MAVATSRAAKTQTDLFGKPLADRPVLLAGRIRMFRLELDALEQRLRDELLRRIADTFGSDVFSATQIWQQLELRLACLDAEITSVRQLGRWLQSSGLTRICRDNDGVIWSCVSADDLHDDASIVVNDDV